MMVKRLVTISVDNDVWTDFKVWCVKNRISASKKVNNIVKEFLKGER